ncbi:MAG: PA14 domain-containing protein, partial [Armatimonadota bacterium]
MFAEFFHSLECGRAALGAVFLLIPMLSLLAVPVVAEGTSPKVIIDALDAKSWNGLVFSRGPQSAFAVRFGAFQYSLNDEIDVYTNMVKVGPHAPDGKYARITWRIGPGPGDLYSIRWEGKLSIPADGDYKFIARADDGVRLWIDGKQIIDEWDQHAPTDFPGTISLTKGEHDIRMDYFQLIGGACIKLSWEGPGIKNQVIPAESLSFEGKPGLKGSYYIGEKFEQLHHTAIDAQIDYDWGKNGPLPPSTEGDLLTQEWSVTENDQVLGKLTIDGKHPAKIILQAYNPWDYKATWRIDSTSVSAKSADSAFQLRMSGSADSFATDVAPDDLKKKYIADHKFSGFNSDNAAAGEYTIQPGQPLYFTARVQAGAVSEVPAPDAKTIDAHLAAKALEYQNARPLVTGAFAEATDTIADNLFWMTLLIPHKDKVYTPAGRLWVWSDWTVFEWDGFFNALLLAVEDPARARSMIDAMMMSQLPDGNIPNFGGGSASDDRSQLQVGTLCIYKIYQRFGNDKDFLASIYPNLVKWHDWWLQDVGGAPRRDGNKNGLLEWGSNGLGLQDAKFESGMDDCPLWDDAKFIKKTNTMDMDCVDANAMYALDCDMMASIATQLGNKADAKRFRDEYEHIKKLTNEKLWNDKAGMYMDRYWDGRFSGRMGVSNFYPLLAGIPDADRQDRMRQVMRDPSKFWGEWVFPTISRDDKAYAGQQYWRGTVWPPSNYLCYTG